MTEWVTQAQALKLLADLGDKISQPALSQYLTGHPEIGRQSEGRGKPTLIDWDALKRSRATRTSRGPASEPLELPLDAPARLRPTPQDSPPDELSRRRAKADTEKAEFDARRARIQAEEAEGRLVPREVAIAAFMAAGTALVAAMEQARRGLIDEVRAAKDGREADTAVRRYERAMRAAFASSLTDYAAAASPDTALAAE